MVFKRNIHTLAILFLLCLVCVSATAYDVPKHVVSLNPLGILSGYVAGTYERVVDRSLSIYVSPSYYQFSLTPWRTVFPDLEVQTAAVAIGSNVYYSRSAPVGPALGLALVGGYLWARDAGASTSGLFGGIEIRVSFRVVWGRFTLAPFSSVRIGHAFFDDTALDASTQRVIGTLRDRLGISPGLVF